MLLLHTILNIQLLQYVMLHRADYNDGAGICKQYSSFKWHITGISGCGGLKLPSTSYATDDNDGAAVCMHYPNLQQIVRHTNVMDGENSALPLQLCY